MYNTKPAPVNRPSLVTAVCIILFVTGLLSIVFSFFGEYAKFGVLYSALNMLLTVTIFASLSGVWEMERWGVWLFSALIVVKFGVDVFFHAFSIWELLLLVPIGVFGYYIKEFSK